MKKSLKSLGFALTGLVHAVREERNIRLFLLMHVVIFALAFALALPLSAWIFIGFLMGMFLVTELLNTSIERTVDTFDDCEKKRNGGHFHPGLKHAKDTAAAASLIALVVEVCMLIFLFLPYILIRL